MGREDQIINERLKKLKELQEQGIETYPSKVDKTQTCLECLNSKIGTTIKTAGRVMTKRDFGQIGFANLKDGTGEIQLVFQTGETKEEVKQFMKKYIDSGDFIQVDGKVFKTKTDQISILVEDIKLI
ncbi:MAG TPA: OB-fold nucleic acid binding domain-containing protein, partial [Candidatus Nanoarchaeia archaeon]|nr:OB-fold nucleic acid binding domain-containing protein [Candidatus Nanoarchaeia archaeon]